MFGIRGRLVSTKQRVVQLFRAVGNLGNKDFDGSSPNVMFTGAPYESVTLAGNYVSEAELKRAKALVYWYEVRKAEALLHSRRLLL